MTTTRTGTRPALPGDHTHHTEDSHIMRTPTRAAFVAASAFALALTAACATDDTDTTAAATPAAAADTAHTADSGASTTVTFPW